MAKEAGLKPALGKGERCRPEGRRYMKMLRKPLAGEAGGVEGEAVQGAENGESGPAFSGRKPGKAGHPFDSAD
jgi:hypothetical protein